ncbi:MAG: SPASM domain-containing protein, partial [Spirochaetia bacterium]
MTIPELAWIDAFVADIKPYIHVRAFDRVLILPPNKVYKLNTTGRALLGALLKGKRIGSFRFLRDADKARQVHQFFCDLRAFFNGCPEVPEQRRAVEITPFDFDYTRLPILGEIALTYRCNNRCSFCYIGETLTETRKPHGPRPAARPECNRSPADSGEAWGQQARGELFFPYTDVGEIIDMIKKQARMLGLTFYWYSPVPHCYYNPLAAGLGNKSCAAMDGLLSVSPNGDVLPCSSYKLPLGNLLRQKFSRIWFSKRAAYFKNKRFAPAQCSGCPDFNACQSACPLYWDYAGTAELQSKAICNARLGVTMKIRFIIPGIPLVLRAVLFTACELGGLYYQCY